MKIQFLGTGAADWDWNSFPAGTRGSTSTLIDETLLIDAGTTGWDNLIRSHVDPGKISELIITHSHSDHFSIRNIEKIAEAAGTLKVRTSPQAAERLRQTGNSHLVVEEIHWGNSFSIGESKITVLPANHALPDLKEESFHFLFDTPSCRWLYALDGGWMISAARQMIDGKTLSLIVWDATSGEHYHDWRFADHNDLGMIDSMRIALTELKCIDKSTRHVFDHISLSLWPASESERKQIAETHSGILAYDGMSLEI